MERLKAAIKLAGGPVAVARDAGVPVSHLGNILCGRRTLARSTATKLRGVLRDVPAEVWVELLAPVAADEVVPEAGA